MWSVVVRRICWTVLCLGLAACVLSIAGSPQLAYRQPIYIAASFAGGIAMALLVIQALLPSGAFFGIGARAGRRVHRITGVLVLGLVIVHVATLWITSPPDVIDALTFSSPTPFSIWGVLAMWGVIATAVLAALRRKVRVLVWQSAHIILGITIAATTILHVIFIDGTLADWAKGVLCLGLGAATLSAASGIGPTLRRRLRK